MKALLFALLIALPLVVLALTALRQLLFLSVVVPAVKKMGGVQMGVRYWLNTTLGSTQPAQTKRYLNGLTPAQANRWPNWYLRYSSFIIAACVVLWCLLLLAAR